MVSTTTQLLAVLNNQVKIQLKSLTEPHFIQSALLTAISPVLLNQIVIIIILLDIAVLI